jgi:hypothetical protein
LPDKPSIAVLPFQNMSGDPEQEYFADGLAQEAEAHAQLALRLSPRGYGIGTAHLALAMAHFTQRNHAEAVRWCESAIQVWHRAPIRRASAATLRHPPNTAALHLRQRYDDLLHR